MEIFKLLFLESNQSTNGSLTPCHGEEERYGQVSTNDSSTPKILACASRNREITVRFLVLYTLILNGKHVMPMIYIGDYVHDSSSYVSAKVQFFMYCRRFSWSFYLAHVHFRTAKRENASYLLSANSAARRHHCPHAALYLYE